MVKKINWILILQAWAILWVVIGHSPLEIPFTSDAPFYAVAAFRFAYSFHMPLFIFVSGYLFYMTRVGKPMPYLKIISEKFQRLGIPFVVFTFAAMVLKSIFSADMSRPTTISVAEFLNAIVYPNDGPMREFWFIAVLMWCFLAKPLFTFLLKNKFITTAGIIVLLLIHILVPSFANDILCFPRALRFALFFFCGMVCCKWKPKEPINRQWLVFAGSILLYAALFVTCKGKLSVLTSFAGIFMSIILSLLLDKYIPQIFASFKNYTYQIYLMGIFFQIFTKVLYIKGLVPYGGGYFLCVATGLYLPVLISLSIRRINWTPLLLAVGLSKSK